MDGIATKLAPLAEVLYADDPVDTVWVDELRGALHRLASRVPVEPWLRWERLDVLGVEPNRLAELVAARVFASELVGIVLSPAFTSALRRQRGLKAPIPAVVLDVQFRLIDEARYHDTEELPSGLRVDVGKERFVGTEWVKVRLPRPLDDGGRAGLDEALWTWAKDVHLTARAKGRGKAFSTPALLIAIEILLAELHRVRDDEVLLRRVLRDQEDEIERLRDKLHAAQIALAAEHHRDEPDRQDVRGLAVWLRYVVATAVVSAAASWGGAIGAPDVVLELQPLVDAIETLDQVSKEVD